MNNNINSQNFTAPQESWFNKSQSNTMNFISYTSAFVLILVFIFLKIVSSILFSFLNKIPVLQNESFPYIYEGLLTVFALSFTIFIVVKLFVSDKELRHVNLFPLEKPVPDKIFVLSIVAGSALCVVASYAASFTTNIVHGFSPVTTSSIDAPDGLFNIVLMFIRTAVIPAILEELVFRGVLLQPLRRYGDAFAIVTTSVFFGLLHGSFSQILFAVPAGLILGYFAVKTGTLWSSICIHFVNNAIACTETLVKASNNPVSMLIYNYVIAIFIAAGFIALAFFYINGKHSIKLQRVTKGMAFNERKAFRKERFKKYFFSVPMIITMVLLIGNLIYSSYKDSIVQFIKQIFLAFGV